MKTLIILLISCGVLYPFEALTASWRTSSYFSATVKQSSYSDLQFSDSSNEEVELEDTLDLELSLRFNSLYQFIGVYAKSSDDSFKYTALGFRIDTIGPFFYTRNPSRVLRHRRRSYPINTSLFATIGQANIGAVTQEKASISNFGVSMDIFLFQPYCFLTTQFSLTSLSGNTFSTTSAGLGWEF